VVAGRSDERAWPSVDCDARAPLVVLVVIKGLGRGGAERLVVDQVCNPVEGVSFEVVNTDGRVRDLADELSATGVVMSHLGGRRWWLLQLRARLRRAPRVDVLHVHSPRVAVLVRLLRWTLPRRCRPVLVTTEHALGDAYHPLTRSLNRSTLTLDDHRFAVSEQVRSALPTRYARRTEVLPPTCDLARAERAMAAASNTRSSLPITAGAPLAGIVGRLRPEKDHSTFLTAARRVADRAPDVRFLVVGDGPERPAVEEQRAQLQLEDAVRLLGDRADAVEVIAACDVLCLSSRTEGLGLVVLEAMSVGVPVVATAAGGVVELLDDGVEGRLVPVGDASALADGLLELLGDAELRARMGAAGRLRASAFDQAHVHATLARRYRELVQQRSHGRGER